MIEFKPTYKSDTGRDLIIKTYNEILSMFPVSFEDSIIDTQYGKTYIIQCGEKTLPPLILLHGTSSNSSMWIGDVAQYSKHYCVYAIDILGEPGKSEEKQYPLKSHIYREWLNNLLEKLMISKASFIGISIGAWLAAGFAVNHPEKVEKLILLCPSGIGPQKISFMFKTIPLMFLGDKGIDKISQLVNGDEPISKEALLYSKLIARNFNLRIEPVPLFTDEELRKLTMPLLLIAGKKDVLLHSKKTIMRVNKLLPHAQTHLLQDRGHVLIGLTDKIIEFLSHSTYRK